MRRINKDGSVNKKYAMKIWSHALKTFCDDFNEELSNKQHDSCVSKFMSMLNAIATDAKSKYEQDN